MTMIDVDDSITIACPVEVVFDFVADQRNAPSWQDGLTMVRRITDGPVGVGTKHEASRKFLGRTMVLTNEYVEYEPNKTVAFTGESGPSRFKTSYKVEPTTDGTTLTCRMQMETEGCSSSRTR
ncbi:MAG TPA: SRPBCC family protein [Aldersonia sp.]